MAASSSSSSSASAVTTTLSGAPTFCLSAAVGAGAASGSLKDPNFGVNSGAGAALVWKVNDWWRLLSGSDGSWNLSSDSGQFLRLLEARQSSSAGFFVAGAGEVSRMSDSGAETAGGGST